MLPAHLHVPFSSFLSFHDAHAVTFFISSQPDGTYLSAMVGDESAAAASPTVARPSVDDDETPAKIVQFRVGHSTAQGSGGGDDGGDDDGDDDDKDEAGPKELWPNAVSAFFLSILEFEHGLLSRTIDTLPPPANLLT